MVLTSKVNFWRYAALFLIIAGTCGFNNCNGVRIKKQYMLAFSDNSSSRIHVRWSENGTTWADETFPNQIAASGVGAAANETGLMRMVLWTGTYILASGRTRGSATDIQILWGLVRDVWDSTPATQSPGFTAASAPYASAIQGGNTRLISYRAAGDIVGLAMFDTAQRDFLSYSLAPAATAAQNDTVRSRPAVAAFGNTVILAWERNGEVRIAKGTLSGQSINWTNYTAAPLDATVQGQGYSGVRPFGPALTHDGTQFLLAFARRTRGSGGSNTLLRDDLFVYSSSDGLMWSLVTVRGGPIDPEVAVAAHSDGSVILAAVGSAGTTSARAVFRLEAGTWSTVNANNVFGAAPKHAPFSIIAVGKPETVPAP